MHELHVFDWHPCDSNAVTVMMTTKRSLVHDTVPHVVDELIVLDHEVCQRW